MMKKYFEEIEKKLRNSSSSGIFSFNIYDFMSLSIFVKYKMCRCAVSLWMGEVAPCRVDSLSCHYLVIMYIYGIK